MAPLPLIKGTLVATIIWTVLTLIHYWLCAGTPNPSLCTGAWKTNPSNSRNSPQLSSTEPQRSNERQKLLYISESLSVCARQFWVTTYKRQNAAASFVLNLSEFCSSHSYSSHLHKKYSRWWGATIVENEENKVRISFTESQAFFML